MVGGCGSCLLLEGERLCKGSLGSETQILPLVVISRPDGHQERGRMGVFGPSSGLQQHLLKEHSSAIFHLNNDLIACELSCFFFFLDKLLLSVNLINHDLYSATFFQRLGKIFKLLNHDANCQIRHCALPVIFAVTWGWQELLLAMQAFTLCPWDILCLIKQL